MRIVVLDGFTLNPGDNPWDEIARLGEFVVYDRTDSADILERARGAQILLTNKTPLTGETLSRLEGLKFVAVLATGFNVVDVAAARRLGIPVSNVPVYGTEAVAQFVFAMLLELCHHVALHSSAVHDGQWQRSPDFCFWKTPQAELAGKRMGIIGFGRIGRRVGELARAFGMTVTAFDPAGGPAPDYEGFGWGSVEEVFSRCDVVSLHCPQTSENEGMVDARLLGLMKPGAFFINTARGGLVNEADLAAALRAGRPAAAAVDVVSTEPIRADNPLLSAPNCVITPHIAWASLEARKRLMKTTVENVRAFLAGKTINLVN